MACCVYGAHAGYVNPLTSRYKNRDSVDRCDSQINMLLNGYLPDDNFHNSMFTFSICRRYADGVQRDWDLASYFRYEMFILFFTIKIYINCIRL